jgi:hypothetical protein
LQPFLFAGVDGGWLFDVGCQIFEFYLSLLFLIIQVFVAIFVSLCSGAKLETSDRE